METNVQQNESIHSRADKYKMQLEDQMCEMKRTIEDLKQKVIEQKEQLWKERHENDKMIREQEIFRRQLSMFHLPHCPVLNSSPCPVHSVHSYPSQISPREGEEELFQGDQVMKRDNGGAMYDSIARNIRHQADGSCEDLFRVRDSSPLTRDVTHTSTYHSPSHDDVTNFALLLTDSCQGRLKEVQQQQQQQRADGAWTDQTVFSAQQMDRNNNYLHPLRDMEPLTSSDIFPNM